MIIRHSAIALCIASFASVACSADAQTKQIQWRELRPQFWIAQSQQWGPVRFSAIRFHLGYYSMSLVDVRSFRDANIQSIREISDNRKFSNDLLDSGINAIFRTWPDKSTIMAVAPAGWSTSLRRIEHSGFLKIGGVKLSEVEDRESLSAIFCLHSPFQAYHDLAYQAPVFFQTNDQRARGESCSDAVQIGPRIIEDPAVSDPHGIKQMETNLRPQLRVIFAVDNPGRRYPHDKPNNKLKENARNAYIIVTESPAHLFDIQEMLLSADFYEAGWAPHWAINMAGGGPSGLIVRNEGNNNAILVGNPSGIIGSALVITQRKR